MVDMGRADDHLGRATILNRQVLVSTLFLAQRMHGWRLFRAIDFFDRRAAHDPRRGHRNCVDRWRSQSQVFKLRHYRTAGYRLLDQLGNETVGVLDDFMVAATSASAEPRR